MEWFDNLDEREKNSRFAFKSQAMRENGGFNKNDVAHEMQGKEGEDDDILLTKCVFDYHRKLKFAAYVTQLDNKQLENFLLRFEFASEPMVIFFVFNCGPIANCKFYV